MNAPPPPLTSLSPDVADYQRAVEELQRSEARLRATVEAAFDCVISMDHDGRIAEFNSAAERVFGWQRDEVIGRMLSEAILPPQHRAAHERGLERFRTSGQGPMIGRLVETTALRRDGTEIPVELAISVAQVPEGNIFVGHLRDISARHAAEADRSALESQLRQAQKMEAVGQLTGGIAHDFNNILTSVVGYVVMAQERAESLGDTTLVRQLDQAHLAAQRARDLISQMLAFSRRQKTEARPLALTPLTRQTLRLLRSTLPSTISLDAQWLDADGSGEASWVVADPVQLEQIIFNLCINARDAMDGAGRITVRLTHREADRLMCASCRGVIGAGPWVELSVADTGSGIAPDVRDRIFDPFFSTKPPGEGSGMGLAMVHGIVHDHGGHILLSSEPGEGASFSVLFRPTAPVIDSADASKSRAGGGSFPQGASILVVEDDLHVGNYLQEQLTSWGLAVTFVRHPAEALQLLQQPAAAVDLLLTDLTMPGMSGLELAMQARQLRPALPIVLATGNPNAIDPLHLRSSGIARLMRKPIEPQSLREVLRTLLTPVEQTGPAR